MKTKVPKARLIAAVRRRIQRFYRHLNRGEFDQCYRMVDPTLRGSPDSITAFQYTASLERFHRYFGKITVATTDLEVHVKTPNRLYDNRDFARARVAWSNHDGPQGVFHERWVRDRRGWWYTRNTGFVTPDGDEVLSGPSS